MNRKHCCTLSEQYTITSPLVVESSTTCSTEWTGVNTKGSSSGNVKTLQMWPHSDECEGKLYFCCLPFLFIPLEQRFSIPVVAPPRSAYFVCYSYRFRCLFYSNVSALRSGHHSIFCHDSSSKRTYIFHSKCIEVCKTWIKIVYIYRSIWCHTRPCVKTLRSVNLWMNVPK